MAVYSESRGRASEVEPFGLLTEGAAGIAVIVLTIVALAGVSALVLASIAAIVIGVGLTVQAFNSAADEARLTGVGAQDAPLGGEVMVDIVCGLSGIVLGILALVGVHAVYLLPPSLIVFGGALLLSGFISMSPRSVPVASSGAEPHVVTYQGSSAASGLEILTGVAALVLGILSVIMATTSPVLMIVGFLVVGAALLMVSATFAGTARRLFAGV